MVVPRPEKTEEKTSMNSIAGFGCVACLLTFGQIDAAFADMAVNVSLWDNGMATDMPTNLQLGMTSDPKGAPFGIQLNHKTVRAGKVVFRVSNNSKEITHEMIVAAVKDPSKPFPYLNNESRVDETAIKDLGEVSELDPGKSGELALDLNPGAYVLFCNVPAHMAAGMWTVLTVMN